MAEHVIGADAEGRIIATVEGLLAEKCPPGGVYVYYRFKKCIDDTDSDYWMRGNLIAEGDPVPPLGRGFVFKLDHGECYYVTTGQSGTTDDHSADFLPVPNTEIANCEICPLVGWAACIACPAGCTLRSITAVVQGYSLHDCIETATLESSHIGFTNTGAINGTYKMVRFNGNPCEFQVIKSITPSTAKLYIEDAPTTGCVGTNQIFSSTVADVIFQDLGPFFPSQIIRWGFGESEENPGFPGESTTLGIEYDTVVTGECEDLKVVSAGGSAAAPQLFAGHGGTVTYTYQVACEEEPPP